MQWEDFDWLIDAALQEDAAGQDVTTQALIRKDLEAEADVRSGDDGVICGLPLAKRLASRFDPRIRVEQRVQDGDRVATGKVVAHLVGPAASILAIERPMLNFLQRLSGMATLTARFVEKVKDTRARIYDTRKTTPGWRQLEKYAVRCGGACNHRMSLADEVLIKDNHLALMAEDGGKADAVRRAVEKARQACPGLKVEVEVENLSQLKAALAAKPDVIMLDNMTPEQVREAATLVEARCAAGPRPLLEASGAISLSNVADYAAAGADRIAVGALTHSAPAFNLSLEVVA